MRKILLGVAAFSMMLATGCTNEEIIQQPDEQYYKLNVSVGTDSRTWSNDAGGANFWGENEEIYVSSADGTVNGKLSLITLTEDGKAIFGGKVSGDPAKLTYSVYPAPELKDGKLSIVMDEIDGKNHNAPMYGNIGENGVNFQFAGGLLRMQVSGAESIDVQAENGDGVVVTGGYYTFSFEGGQVVMKYNESTTTSTKVNLDGNGVFYLPVAIAPSPTSPQGKEDEVALSVKKSTETTFKLITETYEVGKGQLNNDDVPHVTMNENGTITESESVKSFDELKTAVAAGGNVALGADIKLTETLNVNADVTLDMAGYDLIADQSFNDHGIIVNGGTFTLKNSLSDPQQVGVLDVKGMGIRVDGVNKSGQNIIVNIEENVVVVSRNSCSVFVRGVKNAEYANVTINTAGRLISESEDFATVCGNGYAKNVVMNVTGGQINSKNFAAIYFPCTTNLNITGGEIIGYSAVYLKSGRLFVDGEETLLVGRGNPVDYSYNSSGCNETGDALVVDNCGYPGWETLEVVIEGGTFISEKAKAIGSYAKEGFAAKTGFVHGGHFSDPSGAYHMAADANIDIHLEKNYEGPGFKTQKNSDQIVRLVINAGVNYTVTAPLVGSSGTETLGFQFNQGTTVFIEGNGTITSSVAKMLINNYSNLTLNGVTLAPTEIPNMTGDDGKLQPYYVLSNNCGYVTLNHATITAPTTILQEQKVFAMDICKYSTYPSVHVTLDKGTEIYGDVEYTGEGENQTLTIREATIEGNLVTSVDKAILQKAISYDQKMSIFKGNGWNFSSNN